MTCESCEELPYGVRIRFSGQWITCARFSNQRNAEYFCRSIKAHSSYQMYKINFDGTLMEFVEDHLNDR